MAPQMDALSSFVFLTDNLPTWVDQINDLATHTAQRRTEFAAEYTRLLKHVRPRKLKSPSLASNRSNDQPESRGSLTKSLTSQDRARLNPLEAGNRYLLASAREKEKNTGASVRSGASGSRKFRQKHAVVIYYDSYVQDSLNTMVKNISTARNNLRKGKKSRDLMKGPMFSLNNFGSSFYDFKPQSFVGTLNLNPKTEDAGLAVQTSTNVDKCFELADKALEQAQNLCEAAAHQFLRDGDTSMELKNSKERLGQAIKIAGDATARLKEEQQDQEDSDQSNTAAEETGDFDFTIPRFTSTKGYIPKFDHNAAIEVDMADEGSGAATDVFSPNIDMGRYRRT